MTNPWVVVAVILGILGIAYLANQNNRVSPVNNAFERQQDEEINSLEQQIALMQQEIYFLKTQPKPFYYTPYIIVRRRRRRHGDGDGANGNGAEV